MLFSLLRANNLSKSTSLSLIGSSSFASDFPHPCLAAHNVLSLRRYRGGDSNIKSDHEDKSPVESSNKSSMLLLGNTLPFVEKLGGVAAGIGAMCNWSWFAWVDIYQTR